MNTTTRNIILGMGIAVTLPLMASAKGGQRIDFEALDADGNGQVTLAEMQAHRDAKFSEADANGDGFLNAEELAKADSERAQRRVERMLARRDTNDDGQLSAEELAPSQDRMAKHFERLDADNSGGVSEEEFEAQAKKRGRGHKGGKRRGG